MAKMNCWEDAQCERHSAGKLAHTLGVCPASTDMRNDGKNGGKAAGRYCWQVAGTLCGGKVQGTFADKLQNCGACNFFKKVREEEGQDFQM